MEGTLWAFVPALVAIVLALLTKHVYISLFVGVLTGAMFLAGGNPLQAMGTLYTVMAEKVGGNVPIIVFLVILGIFVVLMQESGGATAYGQWAS
ncbi:MAG: Na+/H+ antiporter NhaC family protein, partial [Clostridia bacterium]|nr:Na+/H+ antiporter NhaC family protein [Clostridia bacterium]